MNYFIVILLAGSEPMAIEADDAASISAHFKDIAPEIALCARTTKAALHRAGWTDIYRLGEPLLEET